MRLLLTASRKLKPEHYELLAETLRTCYPNATELWHGGAEGGDQLGKRYCQENGLKEVEVRPDYTTTGMKPAPLKRNDLLVENTDATLACYLGTLEGGTAYTAKASLKAGHETTELDCWTGLNWTHAKRTP